MAAEVEKPPAPPALLEEKEEGEITPPPKSSTAGDAAVPTAVGGETKHPLENAWTLWFDNPQAMKGSKSSNWGNSMRTVYTFATVEEFWCLYNNIITPSHLTHGVDFHCFKEGVKPKWEDPRCINGGEWKLSVLRKDLDTFWLHSLLAIIGEQLPHSELVLGVGISVRDKGRDRVVLWTDQADQESEQIALARAWKDLLGTSNKIGFIACEDSIKEERKARERYSA